MYERVDVATGQTRKFSKLKVARCAQGEGGCCDGQGMSEEELGGGGGEAVEGVEKERN